MKKNKNDDPFSNWIIILKDNSTGKEVARTTTDENGKYIFRDLEPGTYIVEEVKDRRWKQIAPKPPGTHTVTLAAGIDVINKDFVNTKIIQ